MSPSLEFEFLLLNCMSAEYIAEVLKQSRLNPASIANPQESGVIRLPLPIGVPLDHYEKVLGRAEATQKIPGPVASQEYLRHEFSLELWPHLVWSLATVNGLVFGYGFGARTLPELSDFQPSSLKPGRWCLDDLKELGVQWTQVDGWGEDGVMRFEFGEMAFEGAHCFGLFHQWRALGAV